MTDDRWAPRPEPTDEVPDLTVPRASVGATPSLDRPPSGAVIRLDDGRSETIDGYTLIGRDPMSDEGRFAHLLRLDDDERGVSKLHLALDVSDGNLTARDLGSTNLTVVVRDGLELPVPDGVLTPLHVDDRVVLGGTRSFVVTSVPDAGGLDDLTVVRRASPIAPSPPPASGGPRSGPDAPAGPSAPLAPVAATPTPAAAAASVSPAGRCPVCGDLLDPGAKFCAVCGSPIQGEVRFDGAVDAAPADAPPAAAGSAPSPWYRKVWVVAAAVGALAVLAAGAVFVLVRDSGTARPAGLPSVPTDRPTRLYSTDGDGVLSFLAGAPDALYAIRTDRRTELVAFDGSGEERWSARLPDGEPEGPWVTSGRVIASVYDADDDDYETVAFTESGDEAWDARGEASIHQGRVYVQRRNTVDVIDVGTGEVAASERFPDGWRVLDNAILGLDVDRGEASAYSLDLEPLLTDVEIDEEEIVTAYHAGMIVTRFEDELRAYGADGEVWNTRARIGDITSAIPLGGDRWLLTNDDNEVAVESGYGQPRARSVFTTDGYRGNVVNDGRIVVFESTERDTEVRLYTQDGEELTSLDSEGSPFVEPTADNVLIGDYDFERERYDITALSTGGDDLWSDSFDGNVYMLDGGIASVEIDFGDSDDAPIDDFDEEAEYTIEVYE